MNYLHLENFSDTFLKGGFFQCGQVCFGYCETVEGTLSNVRRRPEPAKFKKARINAPKCPIRLEK